MLDIYPRFKAGPKLRSGFPDMGRLQFGLRLSWRNTVALTELGGPVRDCFGWRTDGEWMVNWQSSEVSLIDALIFFVSF